LDIPRRALGIRNLREFRVERVPARTVYVDLGEQREGDPVVLRAELADLLRRAGLLGAELVAREARDRETACGVPLVQSLQADILRSEPALGCDVDGEHHRPGIPAERGRFAGESLKLDVMHGHGRVLRFARDPAPQRAAAAAVTLWIGNPRA